LNSLAAANEAGKASDASKVRKNQTTKDDIARLLHLFKYPDAIIHWSALSRSFTRRELDSRHSKAPSANSARTMQEAADSYGELATIFNDYDNFAPQHAMLKYVGGVRVNPYQVNSDEWPQYEL